MRDLNILSDVGCDTRPQWLECEMCGRKVLDQDALGSEKDDGPCFCSLYCVKNWETNVRVEDE